MIRIEEVKRSERKKGRFLVRLEDGDILRVTEEELLRFGLRAGLELDGEMLEAVRASVRASSAKAAAADIIGSRALSKKELTRRLVKKGNDEADAQAAADWLEDIGAVDDAGYAAALARHYGGKGYGPARVREELRRRGVDRSLWDEALEDNVYERIQNVNTSVLESGSFPDRFNELRKRNSQFIILAENWYHILIL